MAARTRRGFWERVEIRDGCWEWQGGCSGNYGMAWWGGRTTTAHRAAYEMAYGPIPAGLTIDHLCTNTICQRPDHMEAVTNRVNVQRGSLNAAKTHCKRGHEFTEANTYVNKQRSRMCRRCLTETKRKQRAA